MMIMMFGKGILWYSDVVERSFESLNGSGLQAPAAQAKPVGRAAVQTEALKPETYSSS